MIRRNASVDPRLAEAERIWRQNRCIHADTASLYRQWIRRFGVYCRICAVAQNDELTFSGVRRFVHWWCAKHPKAKLKYVVNGARSALLAWAFALKALGEPVPPWRATVSRPPATPLLREFAEYLRGVRGNPLITIRKKLWHVALFDAHRRSKGRRSRLPRLQEIDQFVIACRARYARATVADICSTLRGYLRFLRVTGRMRNDLAASVMAPIVRSSERPHRALPWSDVRRILNAIDRTSRCGRRDFAVLLMMSVYGLGAGEIIGLKLDDIDWRAGTLHVVRPKTRAEFLLPLLPAVARALASYLRHGRPVHTDTRHLFVTMRAPYKALACSVSIRHILHSAAQRAGVTAQFLGTHVLRHTHACRQLELGTVPKVIGDILGHRDPESTSAYLRVATERLREVCLPVPI
jgi:integrase